MERKTEISRLKQMARQGLAGKYAISAGAMAVSFLVEMLVSVILVIPAQILLWMEIGAGRMSPERLILLAVAVIFAAALLMAAILAVFQAGVLRFFRNICTGTPCGMGDLLHGFRNRPWRFAGLQLLFLAVNTVISLPCVAANAAVALMPWATWLLVPELVFLILGAAVNVALWLFCGQAVLLLTEDRNMGVFRALKESVALMRGNKGRLFLLVLSFAGMIILSYMSLGIGFLWTRPYLYCTLVHFYLDIRRENERDNGGENFR